MRKKKSAVNPANWETINMKLENSAVLKVKGSTLMFHRAQKQTFQLYELW